LKIVDGVSLGKSDGGRVVRVRRCQRRGDAFEACSGFRRAKIRHRTDELVAAIADEHVIGADIRANGLADELEQCIAGQMALTVVDLLEAVDVDEREYERGARPMRTLELARYRLEAEPARPGTGQLIRRRALLVLVGFGAVEACLSAFTSCLVPIGRRPDTVVGCLGPIRRRAFPIALGSQQNVLPARARVVL
jgi:hypothetical protein